MELIEASKNGQLDKVKMLIEAGYPNVTYKYGKTEWSALRIASCHGHIEVVKYLLNVGADINTTDDIKWNALMWAVWNGHIDIINILLKFGADIYIIDRFGYSVKRIALEGTKNGPKIVKLINDKMIKDTMQLIPLPYDIIHKVVIEFCE